MDLDELLDNPWASEAGEQQPQYQAPQQQQSQIDPAARQRIGGMVNRISDEVEERHRPEHENILEQMRRSHEKHLEQMQANHEKQMEQLRESFEDGLRGMQAQRQLTPAVALRMQAPMPQPPPAHTARLTIRDSRDDLFQYFHKQQVKRAIKAVPRFEGKRDRHLVTEFIEKVRLLETISGLQSNEMISSMIMWYSPDVLEWFCTAILEREYHTALYRELTKFRHNSIESRGSRASPGDVVGGPVLPAIAEREDYKSELQ
jgi:hypothetical protein